MSPQPVPVRLGQGVLLGLGHPLLDIIAHVDPEFLDKYGLQANDAIRATEAHVPMYDDLVLSQYKIDLVAGGSTQNSLRVLQWIIEDPGVTTFMGSVGDDRYGKNLAKLAASDGVNIKYEVIPGEMTGTCAVLLTGIDRSLCAYLGAANCFTQDFLNLNMELMEKAKFFYISMFFFSVRPGTVEQVADYACSTNAHFMINLGAPFLMDLHSERISKTLPYVDIVFGNETEAKALAVAQGFETEDLVEIALRVSKMEKLNKGRARMVVLTRGNDPVLFVQGDLILQFPVIDVPESAIKDTNGAGDAFVGGFLSQYIQGKSVKTCVNCGIWAASMIIQQLGCTLPTRHATTEYLYS